MEIRPILLDTNAYVSFKKNHLDIREIIQYSERIAISPIVIGELIAGFEGGNKEKQNKNELQEFLEAPRVIHYSVTLDTSQFFSLISLQLKKIGKPIPSNDIWIDSQALEHGCVVCTHDKHFSFINGLISGDTRVDLFV